MGYIGPERAHYEVLPVEARDASESRIIEPTVVGPSKSRSSRARPALAEQTVAADAERVSAR